MAVSWSDLLDPHGLVDLRPLRAGSQEVAGDPRLRIFAITDVPVPSLAGENVNISLLAHFLTHRNVVSPPERATREVLADAVSLIIIGIQRSAALAHEGQTPVADLGDVGEELHELLEGRLLLLEFVPEA